MKKKYDVIVIGAGHAGIEAATASYRVGVEVALITINKNNIGEMSCNPSIGGLGKGHIVKEIDSLEVYKKRIEKAIDAVQEPLHIAQTSLANRYY